MIDQDIFIINWFQRGKLPQAKYIETDGQYFYSYEEAQEYAEKEVATGNRPFSYRIEEIWRQPN